MELRSSRRTPTSTASSGSKSFGTSNFVDPKAVGLVFNYVSALLRATAEFGPREIDPIKVVIVSHGPEVVVFDKNNYAKYKEIVDRAASLTGQGGRLSQLRHRGSRGAVRFGLLAEQGLHAQCRRRYHADVTDQRFEQGRHS
jgi:hypothetical protein